MARLMACDKVQIVKDFSDGVEVCELAHMWEVTTGRVEELIRQAMQRKAWWRDRA